MKFILITMIREGKLRIEPNYINIQDIVYMGEDHMGEDHMGISQYSLIDYIGIFLSSSTPP